MDSSFTIKPPPAPTGRARRDPVPVREAVSTELVAAKTVAAKGDGGNKDDGAQQDGGGGKDAEQHRPDHAPHDLVANPDSRDVIYRERDVRASKREPLDQALLRYRAYYRQAYADPEAPPADDTHADIKA